TYNREWCIENAIKSVITQNYENFELFIVDD
ncbi:MAG: glycosyltransferase, partial [bacterium]|nr:glycosyltransferase [bacterium]